MCGAAYQSMECVKAKQNAANSNSAERTEMQEIRNNLGDRRFGGRLNPLAPMVSLHSMFTVPSLQWTNVGGQEHKKSVTTIQFNYENMFLL